MRIKSVTIHAFGKFHDETFDFDEGLNVVYGLNEQGKSTIHKFIEAMFYGFFKAYTKNRQYEEAYEAYSPWDHNGYGGTITFEDLGQLIRMERQFTKGKDSLKIFDVGSGDEITETYDYNKVIRMADPGIRHFGHNKITYQNTVSMTQMASKTDEAMITEIKDNMSNLASSHHTTISVDKVIDKIDKIANVIGSNKKRTSAYHKLVQEIKRLKEEILDAKAIHKEVAEEKQLENTLTESQQTLVTRAASMKLDLGYIQAIKSKALLWKVEELEKEKKAIEGEMSRDLMYKDFTLKIADRLRVQGNQLREKRRQITGLEDKVQLLKMEQKKSTATMEEVPDVVGLSKTYEGLNRDAVIYRDDKQKLITKENEYKTIERQREMLDKVKRPDNPLKWAVLAVLLLVAGVGMGALMNPILLGLIVVGIGVGLWVVKSYGRQKADYDVYTMKESRLTAELDQVQQGQDKLSQKMAKVLSGHDVSNLITLQEKRDKALSSKSVGESQRKEIAQRRARLALMTKDVEDLSAQVEEQKKTFEDAKTLQIKAFEQFNIASEDEIKGATEQYLAYKGGVEQLKHVYERMNDLLGGVSITRIKEAIDVPEREVTIEEEAVISAGLEELRREELTLSSKISAAVTKQVTLSVGRSTVVELQEVLEEKIALHQNYDHDLAVAKMMKETIEAIAVDIQNNFAPVLNEAMSKVVKTVTAGKYSDIKVNPEMALTIYDEDAHRTIAAESLSAGTIDILYFGLRLGISEVLTEGKSLPLILDDTFVQYDDNRMKQVVEMLSKQERQVLLFTCHTREIDYLDYNSMAYNKVII